MGLFDDEPGYRNTDPSTSRHAKKFNLNKDRVRALEVHGRNPDGLTDYELAAITGKQQNSIGKRRGELCDYGFAEEKVPQTKRKAPSGSLCLVWSITASGVLLDQHLRQLRRDAAMMGLSVDYDKLEIPEFGIGPKPKPKRKK